MPFLWHSLTRVLNSLFAALPQSSPADLAYSCLGEKKLTVEYPQKLYRISPVTGFVAVEYSSSLNSCMGRSSRALKPMRLK